MWTWARRVGLTLLVLVVLVFAVSGAYLGWDRLSPEQVKELSIGTGMPLIYRLRLDGTVAEKRDLAGLSA